MYKEFEIKSRCLFSDTPFSNMTEISSAIPQFPNISNATEIPPLDSLNDEFQNVDVVMVLSTLIASVGIVANFTVIIVFLNDKKLRKKIPNIFIIHQVSFIFTLYFSTLFLVMSPLGLKSRVNSLACVLHHLCAMNSSDSPLVRHLLTS